MPNTERGYPFPSLSAPPNVPADVQALAEAIDEDVAAVEEAAADALAERTAYLARCTTTTALTTSPAAVPGLSISLTTTRPNTKVLVSAALDLRPGTNTPVCVGSLHVDGNSTAEAGTVLQQSARATASQIWLVTLTTPGAHTLAIRAYIASSGSGSIEAAHSAVSALVVG